MSRHFKKLALLTLIFVFFLALISITPILFPPWALLSAAILTMVYYNEK